MEEFRDLDSYYSVSNTGKVKSKRSGKLMSVHTDSRGRGYKYVTLSYDGTKRSFQVHRLVALLFVPNPNNYPCVNHKDENPSNNNVSNLEWYSYSYNLSYGTKIHREHITKKLKNSKNAPKAVIQMDLEGNYINEFPSANEAARTLNLVNSHIIDCCNHKICQNSKGYTWTVQTVGGFKFSWKF